MPRKCENFTIAKTSLEEVKRIGQKRSKRYGLYIQPACQPHWTVNQRHLGKMMTKKPTKRTEAQEQIKTVVFCEKHQIPIFAIPNSAKRSMVEGLLMKRMGTRAGIPDLFIPVPNNQYSGMFIEMKTEKGKLSELQSYWIHFLFQQGYYTCVAYGAEQAINQIKNYMGIEDAGV